VNALPSYFYHSRTSSIITDRKLLDSSTVGGLMSLLPEDERYGLKYVTICLKDGIAGEVDRETIVAALEVFGQIRDSGFSPKDILRELKERTEKTPPAVEARQLMPPKKALGSPAGRRSAGKRIARATKHPGSGRR
jgi:hypothetical protein